MSSSFFKHFYFVISLFFIISFFISLFYIPNLVASNPSINNTTGELLTDTPTTTLIRTTGYVWPTPGYTTITSPFGRRDSPTARSFFLS